MKTLDTVGGWSAKLNAIIIYKDPKLARSRSLQDFVLLEKRIELDEIEVNVLFIGLADIKLLFMSLLILLNHPLTASVESPSRPKGFVISTQRVFFL